MYVVYLFWGLNINGALKWMFYSILTSYSGKRHTKIQMKEDVQVITHIVQKWWLQQC